MNEAVSILKAMGLIYNRKDFDTDSIRDGDFNRDLSTYSLRCLKNMILIGLNALIIVFPIHLLFQHQIVHTVIYFLISQVVMVYDGCL